jgi:hypothetical protein
MTNPDPTSHQEPTPTGDALREYLEVVDQSVDAITAAEVDADLASVLARAGYDPVPVSGEAELRLTDFEITDLPDALDGGELECQVRAWSTQLAKLQVDVAAARRARKREMGRFHEAVRAADEAELRAADARERAHAAALGAEAYLDTALDRAQEILDKARRDAERIVAEAQRQAAEITAAAVRRPAPSLYLPDIGAGSDLPLPRSLRGGEELRGAWEHTADAGQGDLFVSFSACAAGQRAAAPAPEFVTLGSGNILIVGNGGVGKTAAFLSALAKLRDPAVLCCDVLAGARERRMPLALPTVNAGVQYVAEPDLTPRRRTWARLISAIRRASTDSRLWRPSQSPAVESTLSTSRSDAEPTEAELVHQYGHVFLLVYDGRAIQRLEASDRWLAVAEDLPTDESEGSVHGTLWQRGEHVNAQD